MTRAASVQVQDFCFRPAGRSRWALQDVTFTLEPGERVLLLGDSGSGKSTLLRGLAGLLSPSGEQAGRIQLDGRLAERAHDRVGLLLQDPGAGLLLTRAGEDVSFGPQSRGLTPDEVRRRTAWALDAVGFPYPADREIQALSGGERQRLALAGVLALQPGLLLLDEPTSMLDPIGANLIKDAVRHVTGDRDTTLIVVEHQAADWVDLVDRVLILTPDGLVAEGTPQQVIDNPAAQRTWLHPPSLLPTRAARPGAVALTADHVSYRHRDAPEQALSDVDATVLSGSVLAVTGPNGSGKSTLGFILGGLAPPTAGSLTASPTLAAGLTGPPHRWSARELAGRVGSVFQHPEHTFLTARVEDELLLGGRQLDLPTAQLQDASATLVERLRLADLLDANPFTLSGGEQRRLSVAAALVAAPEVLILDEPTFGQDPTTWLELARLFLELRDEGRAIVLLTHDSALVDRTADRQLSLSAGQVVA